MRKIGRVVEVWRYPVSSVGGEQLERISVTPTAVVGDRRFALFDSETGNPAAPEEEPRWRPALFLSAETGEDDLPRLRFPDGSAMGLSDASLKTRLSDHFGFAAEAGAYGSSGTLPSVYNRYEVSPVHIVTTASLARLAELAGTGEADRRRFRPSILIETDEGDGFVENGWIGRPIVIGDIGVAITEATRRCGLTLSAQPGIEKRPEMLRTVIRHNNRNLGVYGEPHASGIIAAGDAVYADF
ncbi:MOSC domain-containing protein [Ciceribacter sp. L1K23]|uniref:MOSC domain-containing protein n=1 Tax=Ciceribacter sp. L1K23 TaxID=2820276 RepID=UPI001B80EE33|nr:MOSC N-terminal beta barrel domain-containing protein [Ciceribacter sp. L1K23]MBR0557396.1 MOSC domain-containing protein [Ciceribacter sp. L1K23]